MAVPFRLCGQEILPIQLMKTCQFISDVKSANRLQASRPSRDGVFFNSSEIVDATVLTTCLLCSYGSHPIYLEHRFNTKTNTSQSHGVFLMR